MAFSASVRTVNGIFPTNGNINTALVGVTTGTSASLEVSSSGDITGSLNEGEVWVISNDPTGSNNGRSFIYDEDNTTGVGTWYELAPTDLATMDARYLKLDGVNSPLQGNVNLGGFQLTNGNLIGTASWALTSSNAISASYAATSSQAISASYIDITGSNIIINYSGSQIQLTGSGDATVVISGSTPGSKSAGSLWFNSNDGNTYIQYSSPTGNVWVPATTNVGQAFSASYANTARTASFTATTQRVTGLTGQLLSSDNREISPSEISAIHLQFGFTSWNNNNIAPWADYLHMRGWGDATGGKDNLVMFNKDGIGVRVYQQDFGSTTPYSTFKDLAFTDASNASGNWPTASHALTAGTVTEGDWISAGTVQAVGVGATTSAPTVPTNTLQNRINYRRVGPKTYEVQAVLNYGNNSGGSDGNGDYLFTLPAGLRFDLSLVTQTQNQVNVGSNTNANLANAIPGSTFVLTSDGQTTYNGVASVVPWDATRYRLIIFNPGNSIRAWGSGNFQFMFNTTRNANWTFTFQST